MNIYDELGELAIAARMKRLYDYIMREGIKIYQRYNLDFDPKHFTAFYCIAKNPNIGVTQLSEYLELSHPAVIHHIKALDKRGLICSQQDQIDKRKRLLCLSEQGELLLPRIKEAWKDIATAIHTLLQEQTTPLFASIIETEQNFSDSSFAERVQNIKNSRQLAEIKILDFADKKNNYFQSLNLVWIEKYFSVEEEDKKVLSDPKKYLLDTGGKIIYAEHDGVIVGTCGLKKWDNETFELVKMGVSVEAQGKQIGKRLGQEIIAQAKQLGCKRLFLESNRKLIPAINLYRRLGFKEVPTQGSCSDYERCDITMEMHL